MVASFNEFAGRVTIAVWFAATTEGPVPKIWSLQKAGSIELELKLSTKMGAAAADFGDTNKPAIRGRRRTRTAIRMARRCRYEINVVVICWT